ncbi:MAG TPA: 2-dehydropantoate 2-reductase [Ardenticatenaceae bacterium]|nr:2-dehydropantoate 2-reductase [Ardenticatenaceae bacterium]
MKIAIFGIGAVGGLIAVRLLTAGTSLIGVVANEEQAETLRAKGLTLEEGVTRTTVTIPSILPVSQAPRALGRDFNLIVIATKTAEMPAAAEMASRHLGRQGALLLVQHGLPEETAALIVPRRRILGAVITWHALRRDHHSVGLIERGETIIGAPPGGNLAMVAPVVRALGPIGWVRETSNLSGLRWHAVGVDAIVNPLSAFGGLPVGEALLNRQARQVALRALHETIGVWQALGVTEEPLGRAPGLTRLASLPRATQHLALLLVALRNRDVRPPMLLAIEHGRRTEIRAINGEIVRRGERKGVETPTHRALIARVEAIESGALRPDPDAYGELARELRLVPG